MTRHETAAKDEYTCTCHPFQIIFYDWYHVFEFDEYFEIDASRQPTESGPEMTFKDIVGSMETTNTKVE